MLKFSPEMRVHKLIMLSLLPLIAFSVAHGEEPPRAVIYFHLGEGTAFDPDYLDNGRMIRRLDSLFSDKPVLRGCDSIVIYSSTSPEGNAAFNRKLSRERGNTLKNYILSNYPDISEEKVYVRMSDNSWSVFRRMVSDDTGMPGRESVLQIIDSHRSESDKVRAILASAAGSYVRRQLFPYLRSAQCVIWCFGDFVEPEPAVSAAKTESPEPGTVVETPKAHPEIPDERPVIGPDKPENKCKLAFAVKTNAALLGATVANLGFEAGFCNGLSLDIPVLYSPLYR